MHLLCGLKAIFVLTPTNLQVLFGLFMIGMSPDLETAGNILVFLVCAVNWFNGIIVPYKQIQVFWRYWVSHPS
jgi:ABC-type multidrug transport system permease subunit